VAAGNSCRRHFRRYISLAHSSDITASSAVQTGAVLLLKRTGCSVTAFYFKEFEPQRRYYSIFVVVELEKRRGL